MIATRIDHLQALPGNFIRPLTFGITGVIKTLGAAILLGTDINLNRSSQKDLYKAKLVFAYLHAQTLAILNPNIRFTEEIPFPFTTFFRKHLPNLKNLIYKNRFHRHVTFRLLNPLLFTCRTLIKICDLAIGIFTALLSFLFLGTSAKVNSIASLHLLYGNGILKDLCKTILLEINPNLKK